MWGHVPGQQGWKRLVFEVCAQAVAVVMSNRQKPPTTVAAAAAAA